MIFILMHFNSIALSMCKQQINSAVSFNDTGEIIHANSAYFSITRKRRRCDDGHDGLICDCGGDGLIHDDDVDIGTKRWQ